MFSLSQIVAMNNASMSPKEKGIKGMRGTNEKVAYEFARGVFTQGSNASGSLFFKDGVCYSYGYHFIVAKKLSATEVAITTRTYSNTTSHHVSLVARHCAYEGLTISRMEL